jgi:ABC-type transporter Mla subunit MlaD
MNGDRTNEADTPDGSDTRTRAWYATRILLAIGIAAVLLAGAMLLLEPSSMGGGPRMVENPFVLAGFLIAVLGLVWMIRIFRGPRDEPPPWRYRDR